MGAVLKSETVNDVCKAGQGKDCCRYLAFGPSGWECIKRTSLKSLLDKRVELGTVTAQGDNCEGIV